MTEDGPFEPDWFSKPGDTVLTLMRRRNVTADSLAAALPGGLDAVRGLFDGSSRVDDAVAEGLSAVVGGSAGFWLKRQANYERAVERVVHAVPEGEFDGWLRNVPVPGGRAGDVRSEKGRRQAVRQRLIFFNVNNLETWTRRYGSIRSETQFRTSPALASDDGAVSMWLRQGELEAALHSAAAWNAKGLEASVGEIRGLSRIGHPSRFLPKLRAVLARSGVVLAIVKAPSGCRASGAARMISPDRAMILMSFRFRADDQFWFTLFHEVGHLVLHGGCSFVDDEETLEDDREQEANAFARDCIIPPERRPEFRDLPPAREAVLRFSVSCGIAPGLTVGQMQHRKMIGHDRLNGLKRRWTWDEIEPALR